MIASLERMTHPTLADVLSIVAKNGFTKEVAKSMNLSKATRECENLQREMREVRDKWGHTQLILRSFVYSTRRLTRPRLHSVFV